MRFIATIVLALASTVPAFAENPEQIAFDVFRNGQSFGEHVLNFTRDGEETRVDVRIRLRAGLGPLTLFRYEHDSREVWLGDALVEFESSTLKDGEDLQVALDSADAALAAMPSSHWRQYETGPLSLLNTETGEPLDVMVERIGAETLQINGASVETQRLRMTGSVVLDLWYDENGNWVRCQFTIRNQTIEYRLRA